MSDFIQNLYKSLAWANKKEVIELFDDITPKFLKETAQRALIEAGIIDEIYGKKIDIYTPSTFTYVEDYSYGRFTSAEYVVYDSSRWDPIKVVLKPDEITVSRYDESTRETETLFSATWNLALTFYFRQYFDFTVTEEEIKQAMERN